MQQVKKRNPVLFNLQFSKKKNDTFSRNALFLLDFDNKKKMGNKLIKRASKINQKHQMKGKIFDIPSFCSGNCPGEEAAKGSDCGPE